MILQKKEGIEGIEDIDAPFLAETSATIQDGYLKRSTSIIFLAKTQRRKDAKTQRRKDAKKAVSIILITITILLTISFCSIPINVYRFKYIITLVWFW